MKLFLKGERCDAERCAIERRAYPPGEHGRGRIKETEYLIQLREKQKAKHLYGVLERQFRNYYRKAVAQKGVTGDNLFRLLETRLDNVLFRGGLASSRNDARQMINHGHVIVNGKKVDITSAPVKAGDVVGIKEKSRDSVRVLTALKAAEGRPVPRWLQPDPGKREITVLDLPNREDIDVPIKESLIIELYSK